MVRARPWWSLVAACVVAAVLHAGGGLADALPGVKAGEPFGGVPPPVPLVGRTSADVPGLVGAPGSKLKEPRNTEVPADPGVVVAEDPASEPRSPYRVDNRIIESRTEPGVLENASNSWLVQFRAMSAGGVKIRTFEGDWLEFEAVEGSGSVPVVDESGTSVTYPEVWPGVDVQYVVTDSKVEEVIVAKRDPGRSEFDFTLAGSAIRADGSGGFDVVRVAGAGDGLGVPGESTGMHIAAVTVTDGSGEPIDVERAEPSATVLGEAPSSAASGEEELAAGPTEPASEGAGGVETQLRVSVDPELFTTADAGAYPIRIDPTVDLPAAHLGQDKYSSIQQGVNLATGNYTAEVLDAHVPAVGPPLEFRRTHNSAIFGNGEWSGTTVLHGLGWGWSSNLTHYVSYDEYMGWAHVADGTARELVFVPNGSGGWVAPPGETSKLTGNTTTGFTLTELDGSKRVFGPVKVDLGCWIGCSDEPTRTSFMMTEHVDPEGQIQRLSYLATGGWRYGQYTPYVSEALDVTSGRKLRLSYTSVASANPLFPGFKLLSTVDEVDANGATVSTWKYGFSTNGYVFGSGLTDVWAPGQAQGGPHTRYVYDECVVLPEFGMVSRRLNTWYRPDGGVEASFGYESNCPSLSSQPASKTDGTGAVTRFDFTMIGNPLSDPDNVQYEAVMTDARGYQSTWRFDSRRRLLWRRDPAGKIRKWNYYSDDDGNPSTVDGMLKEIVHEDDKSGSPSRDTFTYWPSGAVRSQTDRYGAKTWYKYDAYNRLIEVRDPRSASEADNTYRTLTAYPAGSTANTPSSVDPPAPLTATTHTYTTGTEAAVGGGLTPAGLVKQTVSPEQGTTKYFYESDGDLARVEDGQGLMTTYAYDSLGRELSRTESGTGVTSATWSTTYDAGGRVATVLEPAVMNPVDGMARQKKTTNVYDDNGWLRSSTEADVLAAGVSRTTTYGYDLAGREKSETTSSAMVDPRSTLVKQLSGSSTVTSSTEYDPNGNVSAVVDQNGNRFEKSYDSRNNPDKVVLKGYQDDKVANSAPYDLMVSDEDYDDDNRKVAEIDAEGRRREFSSFSYGGNAQVVKLKDFAERAPAEGGGSGTVADVVLEQNSYDKAANLLTSLQGNSTRKITYEYWPASLKKTEIVARVNPAEVDQRTEWVYNAGGQVTTETRKALGVAGVSDRQTRTAYQGTTSLVASRTHEMGATDLVTSYTYDARGNVLSETSPLPATKTYSYDLLGRRVAEASPSVPVEANGVALSPPSQSPTSTFGYDVFGNRMQVKDPNGSVTTSSYDHLDRVAKITYPSYTPAGGSAMVPTEEFGYDPVGNLVVKKGRAVSTPVVAHDLSVYVFDRLNRVVSSAEPSMAAGAKAHAVQTQLYDRVGNVKKVTAPSGLVTESTYDMLNRLRTQTEKVRQPTLSTSTTVFDYDRLGNLTWTKDPRGYVSTSTYNAYGAKLNDVDKFGSTWSYSPSPFGERLKRTGPSGVCEEWVFDQAGRETSRSQGCAQVTTTTYNAVGQPRVVTSPEGRMVEYTYDAAGRRTSVVVGTDAEASTTSLFYDPAGNVTRVRNGRGKDTILKYQSWNLESERVEPAATAGQAVANRTWSTLYDAAGQPAAEIQPGGVRVNRTFDVAGRVRTETGVGATGARSFDYDVAGRVTSVSSPAGAIGVSYNDRDQPLSVSGGNSAATFTYESWGGLSAVSSGVGTSRFTWDAAGRVETQTDPLSGGTAWWVYTGAGSVSAKMKFAAGAPLELSASGNPAIESYQYDNAQRLKSLTSYADLDAAMVDDHDHKRYWSYDNDGLMLSETVTAKPGGSPGPDEGTQSYTYTSLGQLKSWTRAGTTTDYTYDKAGNRTQAGGSTFTYDDQNRLVSGGSATYVWSDRGTMVSRTSGGSTTTYDFDAFAQETRAGSVTYQRDGLGRVSSRNAQVLSYTGLTPQVCNDGSTKVTYTPSGDPLSVTSNGSTAWALLDAHSDLVALLSPSTGKVVAHRSYDPYGVPGESTGTMAPSIGYQADWTDPTTGEVNMGARNYLPAADSFTSRDRYSGRLDTPISLNRYTYAHNNPLTNLDPTGNAVVDPYTQTWDQYWAAVGANINEYKRIEFLNGIANGRKAGFSDEQTQFLLAVHFRDVVDPRVKSFMAAAAMNWAATHPETGLSHTPNGIQFVGTEVDTYSKWHAAAQRGLWRLIRENPPSPYGELDADYSWPRLGNNRGCKVTGGGPNGGTGYADLCWKATSNSSLFPWNKDPSMIWEVRFFGGADRVQSAREEVDRYLEALNDRSDDLQWERGKDYPPSLDRSADGKWIFSFSAGGGARMYFPMNKKDWILTDPERRQIFDEHVSRTEWEDTFRSASMPVPDLPRWSPSLSVPLIIEWTVEDLIFA